MILVAALANISEVAARIIGVKLVRNMVSLSQLGLASITLSWLGLYIIDVNGKW